jgi:hypothetical protein
MAALFPLSMSSFRGHGSNGNAAKRTPFFGWLSADAKKLENHASI